MEGVYYMEKIYTTSEVAELLRVKPLTIRHYILDKRLNANLIGRKYIITEQSLNKFINNKYYI